MKIRTYLLMFALAILLPMLAFSAIAVVAFDRQQRAAVERGGVETARALMSAVDRELAASITVLHALASARSLERDDLATFYDDAGRVLGSQPDWLTIVLVTPAGDRLIDLSFPLGAELPPVVERESVEQVVRTAQPAVGTLALGLRRHFAFPVRVPIVRNGKVVYVLTGVLKPARIGDILGRQQIPADWVGTIFDSKRTVVARTRGTEQFLGRSISAEFVRVLDTVREGWTVMHTLEGAPVYTAFSRSPWTGWGVGLGIPRGTIDAPLRRSLWVIAGGGMAFLVASVALSAFVGKRITGPIVALSSAAKVFGERDQASFSAPRGGPREVDAVARAFTDATALLRGRAAERDEALARARGAWADAEAANRAKDEFLAVLSHELRTPLNAVYGWARMLRTHGLDMPGAEHALDVIERNAAAQIRLIEELLDISRVVTGRMRLNRQPVDLHGVIDSALDSVRPAAEAKNIQVETRLDPAATTIMGDPDRLRQVIWNLLSNAIKFTPAGGRIHVGLRRVSSDVEIAVRDTGCGIAPALLPYVFERFRQADSTSTREHGGLGLGLALVRHLVELHGGTVAAASAGRGHGATFTVTLPADIGADGGGGEQLSPPARMDAATAVPSSLDGLRVLALADAEDSRNLVALILGGAGATVTTCGSVAEALAAVPEFRPHVILADIGIPVEDGYAFVRALRALPADHGGHTPAAALTAYGRPDDARRALASGFQMHVSKPVEPTDLVAAVATLASSGGHPPASTHRPDSAVMR